MTISLDFLESLEKAKIMKIYKVKRGHYNYEYAIEHYKEGTAFGVIELEHNIISDVDGKVVGHFGVNYQHNILAYYLKI